MDTNNNELKKQKLWFRAKNFGWGWYPVSWEGWLSTIIYVLFLYMNIYTAENWTKDIWTGVIEVIIPLIVVSASFFAICFMKGEKPVWRWGKVSQKSQGESLK
jgi:hypothetical protein